MKIGFCELEDWEKDYFESKFSAHQLYFSDESLTKENCNRYQDVEILSPFIYSQITAEVIEKLQLLRLIATRSTGIDHIDTAYCESKNITVANVPSYGEHTVAEHTFALILALSRRLIDSVERTRRADFSLDKLRGFELYGKTLGLIGFGTIAKVVATIAKGFGMNVLAYTRHPKEEESKQYGTTFVDLGQLLSSADIISLHIPHMKETHHFINLGNIKLFKKGSILINTARGPVVETEAIIRALEEGILAGCGLDVLEEECSLKEERQLLSKEFLKTCDLKTQLLNHVLLNKENVIITPHNAFNSHEALQRILEVTTENINNFISSDNQSHPI